jgi:uncharacterized OB-fold protein
MRTLTKAEMKKGYVWKCKVCGYVSKYPENICENCLGDDV